MAPKRDTDGLRPPSRTNKPAVGSRMYALGHAASSSSLVTLAARSSEGLPGVHGAASPEPAAGPSGSGGAVAATEAPYLTNAESHFGRMTLTAPDNMRRKQAKEKKAKAKRKKAAAAQAAAAALAGSGVDTGGASGTDEPEVGPSSRPALQQRASSSGSVQGARPSTPSGLSRQAGPVVVASSPAPRRQRHHSNSRLSTPEPALAATSRSRRSPERPQRPGSAQQSADRATARALSRSNSTGSTRPRQGTLVEGDGETNGAAEESAPANPETQQQLSSALAQQASLRRHNIWQDIQGMPGADEPDPDDLPPPFPEGATRPRSPPLPPDIGLTGEWTEEQRRAQEEAERWRVPDSPPPAFRSEPESDGVSDGEVMPPSASSRARGGGRSNGQDSDGAGSATELSESDDEPESSAMAQERAAWEEDLRAGLSLEERVTRERERREARDRARLAETQGTTEVQGPVDIEDEVMPGAFEEAHIIDCVQEPVVREEADPALVAYSTAQALAAEVADAASQIPAQTATSNHSPQDPISPAPVPIAAATVIASDQSAGVPQPSPNAPAVAGASALRPEGILTERAASSGHRRVSSDGRATRRAEGSSTTRGRHTRIRPRPASESYSRFRDDATAAAERRSKLWNSILDLEMTVPVAPKPYERAEEAEESLGGGNMAAEQRPSTPEVVNVREDSSSSEDDWAAEAAAFEALQRREAPPVVEEDSDDEPVQVRPRRTSLDVLDINRAIPRAPPPLVLGRSRGGGAAYSSSSASSDSDELPEDSSSGEDEDEIEGEHGVQGRTSPISSASVPSSHSLHSIQAHRALDSGTDQFTTPELDPEPAPASAARDVLSHPLAQTQHATRSLAHPDRASPSKAKTAHASFVKDEDEDEAIATSVTPTFPSNVGKSRVDKGKEPVRRGELVREVFVPVTLRMREEKVDELMTSRAGHFQQDSSSSREFTSDGDDGQSEAGQLDSQGRENAKLPEMNARNVSPVARQVPQPGMVGQGSYRLPAAEPPRLPVSGRLAGLFGPVTSRAPPMPPVEVSSLLPEGRDSPPATTPTQAAQSSSRSSSVFSGRERADESAVPYEIGGPASETVQSSKRGSRPSSFDMKDSLSALERLLAGGRTSSALPEPPSVPAFDKGKQREDVDRSRRESSRTAGEAGEPSFRQLSSEDTIDRPLLPAASTQRLSRQGAISNRNPPPPPPITYNRRPGAQPASFINPRSVGAPLPRQPTLPTITDATRHFPPSRQSTGYVPTPSWLAHIPQQERRHLPDPIKPTRSVDEVRAMGPPPVPDRPAGNRVSAMISRFENVPKEDPGGLSSESIPNSNSTSRPSAGSRRGSVISELLASASASASKRSSASTSFGTPTHASASVSVSQDSDSSAEKRTSARYAAETHIGGDMLRRRPPPPTPPTVLPAGQQGPAPPSSTNPFRQSMGSVPYSQRNSVAALSVPRQDALAPLSVPSLSPPAPQLPSPRTQAMDALTRHERSAPPPPPRSPCAPPAEMAAASRGEYDATLAAAQAAMNARGRASIERTRAGPGMGNLAFGQGDSWQRFESSEAVSGLGLADSNWRPPILPPRPREVNSVGAMGAFGPRYGTNPSPGQSPGAGPGPVLRPSTGDGRPTSSSEVARGQLTSESVDLLGLGMDASASASVPPPRRSSQGPRPLPPIPASIRSGTVTGGPNVPRMNSMPSVEGPTRPEAVVDLAGSPPEEQDSEREEEVTASATAAMNGGMRASEPEPEPPSEPSAQNLRRAASRAIHGRDIPVRAGTSAALATRSGGDVTGTDTGTGAGMGSEERQHPERSESLGFTDLDLMVSQLEREGAHYEELAAIGEFLGPAKSSKASAEEVSALPVGRVEVERRRVNKEGRVKQKLSVVGVRVDKCAICLNQFRADQMACVFPCLHIFHERCATRLLQIVRTCPTCRADIAGEA